MVVFHNVPQMLAFSVGFKAAMLLIACFTRVYGSEVARKSFVPPTQPGKESLSGSIVFSLVWKGGRGAWFSLHT